jgi:ERF superfamily
VSEIIKAISKVMEEVGAVKKADRNTHQNFNFRGIDAVVNAVSPALRKHGIVISPQVLDYHYETVSVGNPAKNMASVRVMVRYTFHASDGSTLEVTVPAESFDSGDKATAKAMSVAFRTALLQTLCLPTDETDPDAQSYERANHPTNHTPAPRKPAAPVKEPGESAPVIPIGEGNISPAQIGMIKKLVRECNLESAKDVASNVTGRTITSATDLTKAEASAVIKQLLEMKEALG